MSDDSSFANIDDNISEIESFKILKMASLSKDSMANSFVNVSYDETGRAMSIGDTSFINLGNEVADSESFIKEQTISKILKFATSFFTQIEEISQYYLSQRKNFYIRDNIRRAKLKKEEEKNRKL